MRCEDRRFWSERQQEFPEFNLFSIPSWMQFWFVTFVPKYLNFATFSNDLFLDYDFVRHYGEET
jgi:hypothetical protein